MAFARTLSVALMTAVHLFISQHPALAKPESKPRKPIKTEAPHGGPEKIPFTLKKSGLVLHMGPHGTYEFKVEPAESVETMPEFKLPNSPFPSVDGRIQTVNVVNVTPVNATLPVGKGTDGFFEVSHLQPAQMAPNSPTRAETPFSIHTVLGGGAYRPDFGSQRGVTVMSAGVGGKDVRIRASRAQGPESYYQLGLHVGREEESEEHEGEEGGRPKGFTVHTIYAALRRYDAEKEAAEAEPHAEPMEGEGLEPRMEAPAKPAQRRNTIILGVGAGNEDARVQLEGHIGAKPGVYLNIGVPFWTGPHARPQGREPEIPKPRGKKGLAERAKPEVVRRMMKR